MNLKHIEKESEITKRLNKIYFNQPDYKLNQNWERSLTYIETIKRIKEQRQIAYQKHNPLILRYLQEFNKKQWPRRYKVAK